jgi:hypothetical protein
MSWQTIAERAAKARGEAIVARIRAAIADHAPDADVRQTADGVRARGRSLKRRWLTEPGLRFARRITR